MGFFSRLFGRQPVESQRELPRFVQEEIRRRSSTVAMLPGTSGTIGGLRQFDGQKFRGGIVFSGSSPVIDHNRTRANSREAYHSSTVARAMVSRFVEAVVGDGIRLEPKPASEILGITQEQAEQWARDVKERFNIWASSKEVTLDESMNLYQVQRLAEIQARRDGEYFFRFNYLDDPGRTNPLAINAIEQCQIIGDPYTSTQGLPWTYDGIDRDARGREIAYHVRVRDGGTWKNVTIPASVGGRKIMVHGFAPEYAGQTRGYSTYHHSIQEFSQFTDFSIATVQKSIIQASIVLSKETEANSAATGSPFAAGVSGISPVVPTTAATSTIDDDTVTTSYPDYVPVDASLSPGGIGVFNNGPGERLKAFDNTAPSDQFAAFSEAFISYLSAANSMPYEVLLQKFSSNYSASRAALVQFYRVALILRGEHKSDFLSAVQEAWLAEEIAAGRIQARGWKDPLMRAAWLQADWSGPRMPDIDPMKSVKAARDAVEANLSNIVLEAQNYNGTDAQVNRTINDRTLAGAGKAPWNGGNGGSNVTG